MAVSVVIPAFNAEPYLGEAIDSVLAQTAPPTEVLVIDDDSTDCSGEVARSFGDPVKCVHQPRAGAGAARNRGIELARGQQLAFLDADDVWLPDKLALQLRALDERPKLGLVFGHVQHFYSPELTAEQRATIRLPPGRIPGVCPAAMLIRRDALARVGAFSTRWRLGEFVDWYARAMDARLCSRVLPEVLVRRRLHLTNSGLVRPESQLDYSRVLRAVLARRRGAAN